MALINQNSIIGVTSITSPSASNVLTVHTNDTTERLRVTADGVSFSGTNASLDTSGNATFNGNVSIGGTLTYEDVTNIDSVGVITARAGVKVPDNQKVFLGTDSDLEIYHDGSNARIKNTTGQLWLQSDNGIRFVDSDVNESTARFTDNGAVELYYDGTKKFETTTTGATITNDLVLNHASGDKAIRWATGGTNKLSLNHNNGAGALVAYDNANNAERLRITSNGDLMTGGITSGAGKVQVAGGLRIAGSATHTDTPSPYIYRTSGVDNLCISTSAIERLRITSGGTLESYSPDDTTPNIKWRSNDTNWYGSLNQSVEGGTITSFLSCGGDWSANGTTYSATKAIAAYPTSAIAVHNQYNSTWGSEFVFLTKAGGSTTTDGAVTERLRITSAGQMGLGANNPGDYDGEANDFVVRSANHTGITIASSGSNQRCNLYFSDGTSGTQKYRGAFTYDHNDDSLMVRTAGVERLRIASDGQATFDKGAPASSNQVIARFQAESSRRLDIVWHDSGSLLGFDLPGSHSYIFKCAGSEKLRINSTGVVKFGGQSYATATKSGGVNVSSSCYFDITGSNHVFVKIMIKVGYTGNSNYQMHAQYDYVTCNYSTSGATATRTDILQVEAANAQFNYSDISISRPSNRTVRVTYSPSSGAGTHHPILYVSGVFDSITVS